MMNSMKSLFLVSAIALLACSGGSDVWENIDSDANHDFSEISDAGSEVEIVDFPWTNTIGGLQNGPCTFMSDSE